MPATWPTERSKMVIERVDILDFKNICETRLEFSEGVNCLLGRNGMGKSNLLEALHFVCMARPMTSLPDAGMIRHGENTASVQAAFRMDNGSAEKVTIAVTRGKGKSLRRNGKEYPRLSDHIGRFPIVSVTPADAELVGGTAQERRRMADMVLSQANPAYLTQLIRYNKALQTRNSMLKAGVADPLLYESVETLMAECAAAIHGWRSEWVEQIKGEIADNYRFIAATDGELTIEYQSSLNDAGMEEIFARNRKRDMMLGHTSAGIHRDDIVPVLDGFSLKSFGSQGQVKTFTIALKLAIFNYLKAIGGETPLLLLDDIFDKLDSSRVGRIMELVSRSDAFGQIFITDTNREHLDETLASLSGPKQLIMVEDGVFNVQQ